MGDKKNTGLFNNWVKNFTLTVFMQSFHAFFMLFILSMMKELLTVEAANDGFFASNIDGMVSLVLIVSMMALIKFENLIKGMFGIKSGMVADIKTSAAQSFATFKAAQNMGKSIATPFIKYSGAKQKVTKLGNKMAKDGSYLAKNNNGTNKGIFSTSDIGKSYVNDAENAPQQAELTAAAAAGAQAVNSSGGAVGGGTSNGGTSVASDEKTHQLLQQLVTETRKNGQGGKDMAEEYNSALKNLKTAKREMVWDTATALASTSVGLGAVDELSEAAVVASVINAPINYGTGKVIDKSETRVAHNATKYVNSDNSETSKFGDKHSNRAMRDAIKDGVKEGMKFATNGINLNSPNKNGDVNKAANLGKMSVNVALNAVGATAGLHAISYAKNGKKASKVPQFKSNDINDL